MFKHLKENKIAKILLWTIAGFFLLTLLFSIWAIATAPKQGETPQASEEQIQNNWDQFN